MNTITQPDYPSTARVDDLLVRICVGLQLTKTQYEAAVSPSRSTTESQRICTAGNTSFRPLAPIPPMN